MQVTTERQDPCEVELKIEIDAESVAQTFGQVYREFSKVTNVPGFRKGKAPKAILERYVSPESVRRRAAELMVPDAYRTALEEQDIKPYAEPDVDIVQLDEDKPFVFTAAIPLPPKVELGDYKGIEVKREVREITDEDVEAQLKYLQESRATSQPVEGRGVQNGDLVIAEVTSTVEGEEKSEPRRTMFEVGTNVAGFDEAVQGMESGQSRTFTVEYPEDYSDESLAGKKVEFDVAVESIREREVPELDDEFAKSVGDFETFDALKEDIKTRLTTAAEEAADREVENKIIEEAVNRSKVDCPKVLVDHEMGHELEDMQKQLARRGLALEQYLQQTGKTNEQFLEELREEATRRVRTGLVLAEIADVEKIDVSDEDIDAEITRISEEQSVPRETVEAHLESQGGRAALGNSLLNRKIIDFLKSVSQIK